MPWAGGEHPLRRVVTGTATERLLREPLRRFPADPSNLDPGDDRSQTGQTGVDRPLPDDAVADPGLRSRRSNICAMLRVSPRSATMLRVVNLPFSNGPCDLPFPCSGSIGGPQ